MNFWSAQNRHAGFELHARGGMLRNVRFRLPNGQDVRPLYEAPWLSEDLASPTGSVVDYLGSEFVCLPFGTNYPPKSTAHARWRNALADADSGEKDLSSADEPLHGFTSSDKWRLESRGEDWIAISLDYPPESPVQKVTRTIACDPKNAALNFSVDIQARRRFRRPFGVHPNFRFPQTPGALELRPGRFETGIVHPALASTATSSAEPGAFFAALNAVPAAGNRHLDLSRLPLPHKSEEIVMLCGIADGVELINHELDISCALTWNTALLPNAQLWISNGGRAEAPWNNRNMCIGVEPMASAFDLGINASLADNPVAALGFPTSIEISPDHPAHFEYKLSVAPGTHPAARF